MVNNTNYLTQLGTLLKLSFSLDDIRTLCLELGIDYDDVSGEGKPAKLRELLLIMGRQNRLPELVAAAQNERPYITWPDVPEGFQLPTSGSWSTVSQTAQTVVHGDIVHGDKMGGDKVSGDKITVSFAPKNLQVQQGFAGDQLSALFAPLLLEAVQKARQEQQETAVAKIAKLKTETSKEEKADDEIIANLIQDIVELIPTSAEIIITLFTNAVIAKCAGTATRYVLKRIQR
ncbi:MAG: hypothetical protein H6657_31950 [Ardenticatenaceae bacterium]|nr:hypothetical protein [Ardenticatenaceae bacterium]